MLGLAHNVWILIYLLCANYRNNLLLPLSRRAEAQATAILRCK